MISIPHQDEAWLVEWRSATREPLFFSHDPQVWRMLAAVWQRETVEFRYWGGSQPGTLRRVTPRAVFTAEGHSGIYATGHCHLRGTTRVFRLERVEWPG